MIREVEWRHGEVGRGGGAGHEDTVAALRPPAHPLAHTVPLGHPVTVHILEYNRQRVAGPVQLPATDREVGQGGEVGGLAHSLADHHVVLVLGVKTTKGALARIRHREESLGESSDTVTVVDLSKVTPDDLKYRPIRTRYL